MTKTAQATKGPHPYDRRGRHVECVEPDTACIDPVVALWNEVQAAKEIYDAAEDAASECLSVIPQQLRVARVQYGTFAETPLYAYSEDAIIEATKGFVEDFLFAPSIHSRRLAQQEALVMEFRRREVATKEARDKAGYTRLEGIAEAAGARLDSLEEQFYCATATSAEGILLQLNHMHELLVADSDCPDESDEPDYVAHTLFRSIKAGIARLAASANTK